MPVECNSFHVKDLFKMVCFFHDCFNGILRGPLKRSERLRNKYADTYGNPEPFCPFIFRNSKIFGYDFSCEVCNPIQILCCFRRQAVHEIEFYTAPSAFESITHLFKKVIFRYSLIDDIPHSLRTGFGSKCKACFPDLLCFFKAFFQNTVNP